MASSSFPQASLVESASLIVPGREPVSRKAPDQGPHICEAVLTQRAVYSTPAYSTSFSPPSYAYCTPETVLCLFLHVGETCDAAKGSCCMLQTQSTQDARGLCLLFPFFFFFCSVPLSFFFFLIFNCYFLFCWGVLFFFLFSFGILFCFEICCHVSQAGLKLPVYQRLSFDPQILLPPPPGC